MRAFLQRLIALSLPFLVCLPMRASDDLTGPELLERSIAHHDPDGVWGQRAVSLDFEESRPDGTIRKTSVGLDIPKEVFSWSTERDGHQLAGRLAGGECTLSLDGESEVSEADAEALGLTCERLRRRRDYYAYLWGLPMKLRDPGTRLDESVTRTEFNGRDVLSLRVTYDEEVGGDTWYFYFDPPTAALVGYRFFHDETKNDGEYITLEGEVDLDGMRIPQTRAWYYNSDDGYLGTDRLVGN